MSTPPATNTIDGPSASVAQPPPAKPAGTLPLQVTYTGALTASTGSGNYASGSVTWTGNVSASVPVTITFRATVKSTVTTPTLINNTAAIDDGLGNVWSRAAPIIANALRVFLPLVKR
jgi:hypothetical protein